MSLRFANVGGRKKIVAAYGDFVGPFLGLGGTQNVGTTFSGYGGANLSSSLLDEFFDVSNKAALQALYSDIYYNDHVCGSAVDLRANLPWSDFTLVGADDSQLEVYMDSVEALNLMRGHTELSVDQMVSGAFVGTLVYNKEIKPKGFVDILPYRFEDCDVQPVPLYSRPPILRLKVPKDLRDFALSRGSEMSVHKKIIPTYILDQLAKSKLVDLHPNTTIYLPRVTQTTMQEGISYLLSLIHI